MTPLRIDAHNGAPVWGGAEIALARIVAGLARRGHDVLLHCNDPEVQRRAAALGAPTRRTHLGGDIALHHALRFALALRRRRPDALLLGTFRKLWLGALAGRLAGVPRIVARIGLETDMPRSAKYRYVLGRWVDAVAFNAEVMRARFAEALPEFPGELVTIHTGIARRGRPGAGGAFPGEASSGRQMDVGDMGDMGDVGERVRRELGIPAGSALIGSVGRLASQKRYDRLVRALASLPGAHGLILGEGAERGALESLARELGVSDRLHLPGHADDVRPALGALDVFVLCSDREGMSNAMLEALAAGVPVVSTDVSGAREALAPMPVRATRTGPTNDVRHMREVGGPGEAEAPGAVLPSPEALARTLRALLADAPRRAAMGEAARRVARERFGEERMLDDWERLLGGDR